MLNLRNIEILLTVMSHFDVMSVKILVYSFLVLRDYSSSILEDPWQLKNAPPNATALNDQVHPWWYNFSVARHFCACALTLEVHKLLFVSHENLSRSQYSADGGGA